MMVISIPFAFIVNNYYYVIILGGDLILVEFFLRKAIKLNEIQYWEIKPFIFSKILKVTLKNGKKISLPYNSNSKDTINIYLGINSQIKNKNSQPH